MGSSHGLIDVHSHLIPDVYREAAVAAGVTTPDGMPAWPEWSVSAHLRMMDENGIALALLSVSAPGVSFLSGEAAADMARELNDIASAAHEEHPERFRFLATLPLPDVERSLTELARASKLPGFAGIVMLTDNGGMYPGDETFEPLMQQLETIGCVVLLHPTKPQNAPDRRDGLPVPAMEYLFDGARAVNSLHENGTLQKHSAIRFIGTHSGGVLPLLVDRLDLFRRAMPTMTNRRVSDTVSAMWFDTAGTPMPRSLPSLLQFADPQRILYGSDYCFTPSIAAGVAQGGLLGDHRTDWATTTTANAQRLLHTEDLVQMRGSVKRDARARALTVVHHLITARGRRRLDD